MILFLFLTVAYGRMRKEMLYVHIKPSQGAATAVVGPAAGALISGFSGAVNFICERVQTILSVWW